MNTEHLNVLVMGHVYIIFILNPEPHTSEQGEVNRLPDRKQEDAEIKLTHAIYTLYWSKFFIHFFILACFIKNKKNTYWCWWWWRRWCCWWGHCVWRCFSAGILPLLRNIQRRILMDPLELKFAGLKRSQRSRCCEEPEK